MATMSTYLFASAPTRLKVILKDRSFGLLRSYAMFAAECCITITQPMILGAAINGLLIGGIENLLFWIGISLLGLALSVMRRAFDVRLYTALARDLAVASFRSNHALGVDIGKIAAQSNLAKQLADFFEMFLPNTIRTAFMSIGALVLIAGYDERLLLICSGLVLPAALVGRRFFNFAKTLSHGMHSQFEHEISAFSSGEPATVAQHYDRISQWRIQSSDTQGKNLVCLECFVLSMLVACLSIYCNEQTRKAGDVFALYRYLMLFVSGIDGLPNQILGLSRFRDIYDRLRQAKDAAA